MMSRTFQLINGVATHPLSLRQRATTCTNDPLFPAPIRRRKSFSEIIPTTRPSRPVAGAPDTPFSASRVAAATRSASASTDYTGAVMMSEAFRAFIMRLRARSYATR